MEGTRLPALDCRSLMWAAAHHLCQGSNLRRLSTAPAAAVAAAVDKAYLKTEDPLAGQTVPDQSGWHCTADTVLLALLALYCLYCTAGTAADQAAAAAGAPRPVVVQVVAAAAAAAARWRKPGAVAACSTRSRTAVAAGVALMLPGSGTSADLAAATSAVTAP